jgi:hypothetical protein
VVRHNWTWRVLALDFSAAAVVRHNWTWRVLAPDLLVLKPHQPDLQKITLEYGGPVNQSTKT